MGDDSEKKDGGFFGGIANKFKEAQAKAQAAARGDVLMIAGMEGQPIDLIKSDAAVDVRLGDNEVEFGSRNVYVGNIPGLAALNALGDDSPPGAVLGMDILRSKPKMLLIARDGAPRDLSIVQDAVKGQFTCEGTSPGDFLYGLVQGDDAKIDLAPTVDLIDTIVSWSKMANETVPKFGLFPPQVVCGGNDKSIPDYGKQYNVPACGSIDFIRNTTDVLAFGLQSSSLGKKGGSFCVALNPLEPTIAIAQKDLLPELNIKGIVSISLDALGVSGSRGLSLTTKNKMWDGKSKPAKKDVPGHFLIRGTGKVGLKLSKVVKVGLSIKTSLLLDLEPNRDESHLLPATTDDDATKVALKIPDENDDITFGVLASGEMVPTFQINKWKLQLGKVISAKGDFYMMVNGDDTTFQLAASVNARMEGVCDALELEALCHIFDKDSGITGAARAYADKDGVGIQLQVEGNLGMADPVLNKAVGWPEDGHNLDAQVSAQYTDGGVNICFAANGTPEKCLATCSEHSQCNEETEYCHLFGVCVPKDPVATPCFEDVQCKSDVCAGTDVTGVGFCSECPVLDGLEGCPEGQFCAQQVALGFRCEDLRPVGGACLHDTVCQSGHCVGGFCSECPVLDSEEGCPANQFCAQQLAIGLRCETKRPVGATCSADSACESNTCVRGFCSECRTIDSSNGCASNEFCTQKINQIGLRCERKRSNGATCLSNNVCGSGVCEAGFCRACGRNGRGCSNNEFCDMFQCKRKLPRGRACVENRVCSSNSCSWLTCN
ncbi:MAG: hypothetical protein SGILL_007624 [Bacillariaceae sp.]